MATREARLSEFNPGTPPAGQSGELLCEDNRGSSNRSGTKPNVLNTTASPNCPSFGAPVRDSKTDSLAIFADQEQATAVVKQTGGRVVPCRSEFEI